MHKIYSCLLGINLFELDGNSTFYDGIGNGFFYGCYTGDGAGDAYGESHGDQKNYVITGEIHPASYSIYVEFPDNFFILAEENA